MPQTEFVQVRYRFATDNCQFLGKIQSSAETQNYQNFVTFNCSLMACSHSASQFKACMLSARWS